MQWIGGIVSRWLQGKQLVSEIDEKSSEKVLTMQ